MFNNNPSINMTMVGFGQAGTRMVDRFAEFGAKGKYTYNCLALNSNDGDLSELKNVPIENRFSLNLGGLGKNPEKAMAILEEDENVREKLKEFITKRVRPQDELVLFFAGLGGGTGTSTVVRAIEEFYDYNNKPKIIEELKNIQQQTDPVDFSKNINKYKQQAFRKAQERFVKIGVIVTTPVRSDGPDVLRQVSDFADRIWKTALNPAKGIAFVKFPDNQFMYDRWKELGENAGANNYRDFANNELTVLHELNMATNSGGTSITFDSQDFRRVILEGTGCLVISKIVRNVKEITNSRDIKNMFIEAVETNLLHQPIVLQEKSEDGGVSFAKVHHVGLLGILSQDLRKYGSSFLDEAKQEITEKLPLTGTVFNGYVEGKTNYQATAYTFFKVQALPERLSKGLVMEYEEFMTKQKQITYKTDQILRIEEEEVEIDVDIDLAELGIEVAATQDKPKQDNENIPEIDIMSLDLSDIDIDND